MSLLGGGEEWIDSVKIGDSVRCGADVMHSCLDSEASTWTIIRGLLIPSTFTPSRRRSETSFSYNRSFRSTSSHVSHQVIDCSLNVFRAILVSHLISQGKAGLESSCEPARSQQYRLSVSPLGIIREKYDSLVWASSINPIVPDMELSALVYCSEVAALPFITAKSKC